MPRQNKTVAVDILLISSRSRTCVNCGRAAQTLAITAFAPLDKMWNKGWFIHTPVYKILFPYIFALNPLYSCLIVVHKLYIFSPKCRVFGWGFIFSSLSKMSYPQTHSLWISIVVDEKRLLHPTFFSFGIDLSTVHPQIQCWMLTKNVTMNMDVYFLAARIKVDFIP